MPLLYFEHLPLQRSLHGPVTDRPVVLSKMWAAIRVHTCVCVCVCVYTYTHTHTHTHTLTHTHTHIYPTFCIHTVYVYNNNNNYYYYKYPLNIPIEELKYVLTTYAHYPREAQGLIMESGEFSLSSLWRVCENSPVWMKVTDTKRRSRRKPDTSWLTESDLWRIDNPNARYGSVSVTWRWLSFKKHCVLQLDTGEGFVWHVARWQDALILRARRVPMSRLLSFTAEKFQWKMFVNKR